MTKLQTPHEWWTAEEAAEYCRCSVATLYMLVKTGKIKTARVTGMRQLRFRKEWIDQWLEKSTKSRKVAV